MNKYLKVFLALGISSGVGAGLLTYLLLGIDAGIFMGLRFGVLYSLIMTIYFFFLIKRKGLSDEETQVHQICEIELSLPYDEAFRLCLKSLDLFKKHKIKENNFSQGKIVVEIRITSTFFGIIVISFYIARISSSKTHIKISSKPKIPTALIDLGANYNTVKKIEQFLKENEVCSEDL